MDEAIDTVMSWQKLLLQLEPEAALCTSPHFQMLDMLRRLFPAPAIARWTQNKTKTIRWVSIVNIINDITSAALKICQIKKTTRKAELSSSGTKHKLF